MCSVSEVGSYLRLKDFVYHSSLGLGVMKKRKKKMQSHLIDRYLSQVSGRYFLESTVWTLDPKPSSSPSLLSSIELSDARNP
jgi:hypothetical protein